MKKDVSIFEQFHEKVAEHHAAQAPELCRYLHRAIGAEIEALLHRKEDEHRDVVRLRTVEKEQMTIIVYEVYKLLRRATKSVIYNKHRTHEQLYFTADALTKHYFSPEKEWTPWALHETLRKRGTREIELPEKKKAPKPEVRVAAMQMPRVQLGGRFIKRISLPLSEIKLKLAKVFIKEPVAEMEGLEIQHVVIESEPQMPLTPMTQTTMTEVMFKKVLSDTLFYGDRVFAFLQLPEEYATFNRDTTLYVEHLLHIILFVRRILQDIPARYFDGGHPLTDELNNVDIALEFFERQLTRMGHEEDFKALAYKTYPHLDTSVFLTRSFQ